MSKCIIKKEKKCFDKFSSANSSKQTYTKKTTKKKKIAKNASSDYGFLEISRNEGSSKLIKKSTKDRTLQQDL